MAAEAGRDWILEYYQALTDGSAAAGRWVKLAYKYIVDGLQNRQFVFSMKKASRAIRFIEGFCRHHEGALAPGLIRLELWQKALISVIFGVLDAEGNRQFREVFVVMGRKNGKTLLAAAISAYMFYMDGEYGARLYYCAPKLDQARLCYDGFFQMIMKEPELAALVRKRRTDVYMASTNSSAMPLAFNAKKSDGLNPSLTICDEVAAWDGDAGIKQYEVLKSALGARRQPLLLSISTAGYVNEGIYDELVKRASAVLMGGKERRFLPIMYTIDDVSRWNDINELRKANPNLGVSVSVDYLLDEIAVAEGSFSKRAEFITKYANVKQASSLAWVDRQTVERTRGEHEDLADFADSYCVAGLDLSMTRDLTAACIIIERAGRLHVFAHFWLPEAELDNAITRDRLPYRAYIERGILSLSEGSVVNPMDAHDWIMEQVREHRLYILKVGYDQYMAPPVVQAMEAEGFHMVRILQGEHLTSVIPEAEGLLLDGRISVGDNDLMVIHLLDCAKKVNADNDRCRLTKLSTHAHIDGVAAMIDALAVRQFFQEEIGAALRNEG